jgi:hypothetical protein
MHILLCLQYRLLEPTTEEPLTMSIDTQTLQRWYEKGVQQGAVTLNIIVDTFPEEPEEYPEYLKQGEQAAPLQQMSHRIDSFDLTKPLDAQIKSRTNRNYMGCSCHGPCNCG